MNNNSITTLTNYNVTRNNLITYINRIVNDNNNHTTPTILGGRIDAHQIINSFHNRLENQSNNTFPRVSSINLNDQEILTYDSENIDILNNNLNIETRQRLLNTLVQTGNLDLINDEESFLNISDEGLHALRYIDFNINIMSILSTNIENNRLISYVHNLIYNNEPINDRLNRIINLFIYSLQNPLLQSRFENNIRIFNITDLFMDDLRDSFQALMLLFHTNNIEEITQNTLSNLNLFITDRTIQNQREIIQLEEYSTNQLETISNERQLEISQNNYEFRYNIFRRAVFALGISMFTTSIALQTGINPIYIRGLIQSIRYGDIIPTNINTSSSEILRVRDIFDNLIRIINNRLNNF